MPSEKRGSPRRLGAPDIGGQGRTRDPHLAGTDPEGDKAPLHRLVHHRLGHPSRGVGRASVGWEEVALYAVEPTGGEVTGAKA